jgi:hypothetical protein
MPDTKLVFDMEMKNPTRVNGCPNYIFCRNTRNRVNRKDTYIPMFSLVSRKMGKDQYFWYEKKHEMLCMGKQFENCDYFYYKKRAIWLDKDGKDEYYK